MVLTILGDSILCVVSIVLLLVLVKAKKQEGEVPPLKEFIKSILSTFREKGRWLIAIFALGAIIMLILFGILFLFVDYTGIKV